MKHLFFPIVALTSLTFATAQAATLYQSDFTTEGQLPSGWVVANTSSGVEAAVESLALKIRSGSKTDNARNFVILNFDRVTLEKDGDYISLLFTLATKDVPNQNNNIRFGLFDSRETVLKENTAGPNPSELQDDAGYVFRLATNTDTDAGNVSRYYMSEGSAGQTALTSNLGTQTQLGDENMTGVQRQQKSRKVEMTLTREGDKLSVKVFFNGNLQTDGRIVENPVTFTFDEAVFSTAAPDFEFWISDLAIETNVSKAP